MKHGFFQITQKVFIRKNNLLLVMKDKKSGQGDLPGGRMNVDEFFQDWLLSVYRELEEELGPEFKIKIEPTPYFIHKHLVNDGNHPCIIIAYTANYISGDIKISDEHDFYKWVDVYSYEANELFSEYMLEAVNLYLNRCKHERLS